MHFHALAADYDGTLAQNGTVDADTIEALKRFRASGRRLILVTGREMSELRHAFPQLTLFDRIVAENGGVLHRPGTGEERTFAPSPPVAFVRSLMERGVEPISVGRTIVATWLPHDKAVLDAIAELGLELQITFNKGAVMVLPAGVNKATGLGAALEELELSSLNVVAVGDAENDHAFLKLCGCSAAVANAISAVRQACDIVLTGDHGAGVAELIDRIIREDAQLLPPARVGVLVCTGRDGGKTYLRPQESMLVAGGSGSGKSRFITAMTERMAENRQEFCLIDPEGDYLNLEGAMRIGDEQRSPSIDEAIQLLRRTNLSVVVNTLALDLPGRRGFFERLLPAYLSLRARTGRPRWLIVDEAHHFLPRIAGMASAALDRDLSGTILVTLDPAWLAEEALKQADALLAFGRGAPGIAAVFAREAGLCPPLSPSRRSDEVLLLLRADPATCRPARTDAPRQEHERHKGKYALGNLGHERSFHFVDGSGHCLGSARNLADFIRLAREAPDAVWDRHLHAGDFRAWFLDVIRDEELACRAAQAAEDLQPDGNRSRKRIIDSIRERYVIPDHATPERDSGAG